MGTEVKVGDELTALFGRAAEACLVGIGTEDYENELSDLLQFVLRHPEIEREAEGLFRDALNSQLTPWELVAFCMYELRYESVKEEVIRQLELTGANPRDEAPLRRILEAFDDSWSDRDMFARFSE